jgi:GNAT superfamily N-acetyltransferase
MSDNRLFCQRSTRRPFGLHDFLEQTQVEGRISDDLGHLENEFVLDVQIMTEADVPWGMRLKAANGWNQTEADWRRYLELQTDGCFVAVLDGESVGTVTTCIFESVAWIAMMLVDSAHRGKGIGKALMRHALKFLQGGRVRSIRLDATVLGQPLYEKLGFVAEYSLNRYEGILPAGEPAPAVGPLRSDDMEAVLQLDRTVTRTDRRKLLPRLATEFPGSFRAVRRGDRLEGFLGARPGARALQIGPCLAEGTAGLPLLDDARHRYGGSRVYMDVPAGNEPAARWAEDAGLTVQRRLLRMCYGPALDEQVNMLWCSSGPEMG